MSEVADIVRHALDQAGIVVSPDEVDTLVAVYDMLRERVASLYLPEADGFEPADVFLAAERD